MEDLPNVIADLFEGANRLRSRMRIRTRLEYLRYQSGFEPIRRTRFLDHDFFFPAGSLIGRGIAQGKDHDSIFRELASSIPELGEGLVVDVGANLGTTTLQLLAGNPKLRVLAVEPSRRFSTLLARNLRKARTGQTVIASALLGRAQGRALLYDNSSSASVTNSRYLGHTPLGRGKLPMSTLDVLVEDRGSVSMIKTDCDGYDIEVLRGAVQTLEKYRPLLFVEFSPHLDQQIVEGMEWLRELGYETMYCLAPPDATFLTKMQTPAEVVAVARQRKLRYLDVICLHGDSLRPQLEDVLNKRSGGSAEDHPAE